MEGNPYQPLAAEAYGFMQSRVDDYYAAFTKGVSKGRKVGIEKVRNGMGQGRVLGADSALAEGMIDGIMTLDDVIRKMSKAIRTGSGAGAEVVEAEITAEVAEAVPQAADDYAVRAAARARELEIASL